MMMKVVCNRQQNIHVHCFKGIVEVVETWLRKFPNLYFGVAAAVRCFDCDQRAGLQAIPSNKLILGTDAPYFPLGNAHVSTPAYLGEVAAFVAVTSLFDYQNLCKSPWTMLVHYMNRKRTPLFMPFRVMC